MGFNSGFKGLMWQGDNMFRPLSPGHHKVTRNWNLRKLHTVIHKISYTRYINYIFYLYLYNLFYELQCVAFSNFSSLWPDDGLVIEAETCCHLITLNKINIYNTSCVLTYKNFTPYLYYAPSRHAQNYKTCCMLDQLLLHICPFLPSFGQTLYLHRRM